MNSLARALELRLGRVPLHVEVLTIGVLTGLLRRSPLVLHLKKKKDKRNQQV